jgi:26S proteasome regulatory subunit N6
MTILVRTLIDIVSEIPNTVPLQIELCKDSIEWAKETKRNFLRQRIETRLASLYKISNVVIDTLGTLKPGSSNPHWR